MQFDIFPNKFGLFIDFPNGIGYNVIKLLKNTK